MTPKNKTPKGFIATGMAVIIAMCMTVVMTGCSSTELVDTPQPAETKGQTITLNISCPEAAQTRAGELHEKHVLRYVAVLYEGKVGEDSYRQRKEIIESASTDKNQITFHVENKSETTTYNIIVFADYIPSDSQPIDEDHFPNKYYNFSQNDGRLYMRSVKDFPNNDNLDFNCINNENYDCFAKYITVDKKGEAEVEKDVVLQRIVSRISLVNTTTTKSSIASITFDKFDFYSYCNLDGINPSVMTSHVSSSNTSISVSGITPLSTNIDEELLFFYTLADNTIHNEGMYEIKLSINYTDDQSYVGTIRGGTIKPLANYKIKVRGAFLAGPTPQYGDIILNLSTTDREIWDTSGSQDVTIDQ